MAAHATECRPANSDPWTVVRRWPVPAPGKKGLSPVAKCVWIYLYQIAGGICRSVIAHAANIGRETGLSERAVRRALKTLGAWGLIKIADRFNGELTIDLEDPQRVASMRLVPAESIGQGELQFPDTPGSPSEVPLSNGPAEVLAFSPVSSSLPGLTPQGSPPLPDPPADLAPKTPADLTPNPPPKLKALNSLFRREQRASSLHGGFDAKAAAPSTPSTASLRGQIHADPAIETKTVDATLRSFDEVLAKRVAQLGAAQAVKAKEIARWLLAQLGPIAPNFLRWTQGKCQKIAWAMLEDRLRDDSGRSTQELVSDVLLRSRSAKVRNRATWFLGTMREEFTKAGHAWDGKGREA